MPPLCLVDYDSDDEDEDHDGRPLYQYEGEVLAEENGEVRSEEPVQEEFLPPLLELSDNEDNNTSDSEWDGSVYASDEEDDNELSNEPPGSPKTSTDSEPSDSDSKQSMRSNQLGLTGHMDVIQGAVHVSSLFPSPVNEYPYGAIGMAAAGAYRVALLWCLRKLAYDSKGSVYAIKAFNNNTGKWSNKDSAFSISNFGRKAIQCSRSARKLSIESLDKLVEAALNLAHIETSQTPLHAPPELNIDLDFDFAMLTEVEFYLSILDVQLIFPITSGLVRQMRHSSRPMGCIPNQHSAHIGLQPPAQRATQHVAER
ncbi:hypothetical protein C8Q79DRAFT_925454 [Trametes meyenii]|nr:hypothetical protein C8Q79DRAFT_925454 [Trametes meyenii]